MFNSMGDHGEREQDTDFSNVPHVHITPPLRGDSVRELILNEFSHKDYLSGSYLSQVTGLSPQALRDFASSNPSVVQISKIIPKEKGETLFYHSGSTFSNLKDVWRAFRDLNAKKY